MTIIMTIIMTMIMTYLVPNTRALSYLVIYLVVILLDFSIAPPAIASSIGKISTFSALSSSPSPSCCN